MQTPAPSPIPNLFLVGSPKCGTTSVGAYLGAHPDVFFASPKEPNFFCSDLARAYRAYTDLRHYLDLFRNAVGKRYAAEGSVSYLFSRTAVGDALRFNPTARFVAFVRNPLELVVSLHRQQLNNGEEDVEDFATAWKLQEARRHGRNLPAGCREPAVLQYAQWARQGALIERFFETVPPSQRHVVVFDDLRSSPARLYEALLGFLQLSPDGRDQFPVANQAFRYRFPRLMDSLLRPPRGLQALGNAARTLNGGRPLGVYRWAFEMLDRGGRRAVGLDAPPAELLTEMRDDFRNDVARLSDLLERDLCHWLREQNTSAEVR